MFAPFQKTAHEPVRQPVVTVTYNVKGIGIGQQERRMRLADDWEDTDDDEEDGDDGAAEADEVGGGEGDGADERLLKELSPELRDDPEDGVGVVELGSDDG